MSPTLTKIGWCVWIAAITASATMNYLAGFQLGRTTVESQAFALAGIAADAWKAIGPIVIVALFAARRWLLVSVATLVWLVCAVFAMTAALGLAAQSQATVKAGRTSLIQSYADATREISDLERRRERLTINETPAELEMRIAAALAQPAGKDGTVASLSNMCRKDHWRARSACAGVADLKHKHASALEAERLDGELAAVRERAEDLRENGGTAQPNPQAALLARLTGGYVSQTDVELGLIVLLVVMLELISAFVPVLLREANKTTKATRRRDPPADAAARIFTYISACLSPDPDRHTTTAALFKNYVAWCQSRGERHLGREAFAIAFAQSVSDDLAKWIRKDGNGYRGIALRQP